jgi:molecular chaperone HscB
MVDLEVLQHKYRDLQKAVHPDKFAAAGNRERRLSMQQTSLINQAYNALKHPVERAVYLLSLKGIDLNMDRETTMDAGFLMEQLELREKMADAQHADDPLRELDALRASVRDRSRQLMEAFSRSFDEADYEAAREIVRKLQFLHKGEKEVDEMTARIEDELM